MYDNALEQGEGLEVKEGSPSGHFQVLQDTGFYPDIDVVRSKPSERNPIHIHLPAVQISCNSNHGLGNFFLLEVIPRIEVDFPFFGKRHITAQVHCLSDIG